MPYKRDRYPGSIKEGCICMLSSPQREDGKDELLSWLK